MQASSHTRPTAHLPAGATIGGIRTVAIVIRASEVMTGSGMEEVQARHFEARHFGKSYTGISDTNQKAHKEKGPFTRVKVNERQSNNSSVAMETSELILFFAAEYL